VRLTAAGPESVQEHAIAGADIEHRARRSKTIDPYGEAAARTAEHGIADPREPSRLRAITGVGALQLRRARPRIRRVGAAEAAMSAA
jgi:hypothetical protein